MKRIIYESDWDDAQWELVMNIIPVGCNAKIDRRLWVNAVFYMRIHLKGFARDFNQIYDLTLKNLKTGCQWRQLPKDFPQWQTVYSLWRNQVSYAVIDSRSLETHNRFKERGYDGYKKK